MADNTIDIQPDNFSELQADRFGDFLLGDNSNRYIEYFVRAHRGHYREFPLVGIGIESYLNATADRQIIERDILEQLQSDIFSNPDVDLSEFPDVIKINKVVIEKEEN